MPLFAILGGALSALGGGSAAAGASLAAAGIGAGAALSGAGSQANAINNASQAQQQAQQAAIDEQRREFGINQGNLTPWLNAGQSALNQQLQLLGLGGLPGYNSKTGVYTPPGGSPGASPGGGPGATPGRGPASYTGTPALSAQNATPDWESYVRNNPDILDAYNAGDGKGATMADFGKWHWQQFGQNEYNTGDINRVWTPFGAAQYTTTPGGQTVPTTSPSANPTDLVPSSTPVQGPDAATLQQQAIDGLKNGPLYQSLYRNGVNTILSNASATGGLRGGNVERSLADFGNDALSTVIQNQLANLGAVSGNGQGAGGTIGSLNAGTGANISALLSKLGSTQSGGIIASSAVGTNGLNSAISDLLKGLSSAYSQQNGGGSVDRTGQWNVPF